MRLQAFAVRQHQGDFAQDLRAGFADFNQAAALLEVVDAQRAAETGRAGRGQDVVRSRAVVAQGFAGVGPQKDRAGVFEQRLPAVRVAAGDFQVLGGDAVADVAGLFHAAGQNQRASVVERLGYDGGAGHVGQEAVDAFLHLGDIGRVRAEQDALRQFVVLSLAEQIHRHPVGRGAAIGQDQNLAWAGDHVDADRAKHAALGGGHVGIAGTGDFVDFGDGGRAVGQSCDRLCPTNGEGAADTSNIRRSQNHQIFLASWGRNDHDDLADTGDVRRNRVHQHAGWVGGFAAWHIDANTVQRGDFLAQKRAVFVAVAPAFAVGLFLCFVVAADAFGSGLQGLALFKGNGVKSGFQLGLCQFQTC